MDESRESLRGGRNVLSEEEFLETFHGEATNYFENLEKNFLVFSSLYGHYQIND